MTAWKQWICILSIMAGTILFAALWPCDVWATEGNLLTIFDGGQNEAVPDEQETDPGAFTVGFPLGQAGTKADYEFPLMELQIIKNQLPRCEDDVNYEKGTLFLRTTGSVHLWKDYDKTDELQADDGGYSIPLAEMPDPIVIWVEALVPSEMERDIEITAEYTYEECAPDGLHDTVNATAMLAEIDLDAYWPAKRGSHNSLVSDTEEAYPSNLFMAPNTDDDDKNGIVDNDRQHFPTVASNDDELIKVVVRKLESFSTDKGTLRLVASNGLRFFTEDGMQELDLPLILDLANLPTDSEQNPLADVVNNDVVFLVEANRASEDAAIKLSYLLDESQSIHDEIHLTVLNPEIAGSFTQGEVDFSETAEALDSVDYTVAMKRKGQETTTGQAPDIWYVHGTLAEDKPLSVLIPVPTHKMWYKRIGDGGTDWQEGTPCQEASFGGLADIYNTILENFFGWLFDLFFDATSLFQGVSKASRIPESELASTYFRIDSITEPGTYHIRLALQDAEVSSVENAAYTLELIVLEMDLDVDARWPGVPISLMPLVKDSEENDPVNLFMMVNDDDDNFDGVADNNRTQAPAVADVDNDLIQVIVREFSPPIPGVGTLTLSASPGMRFFRFFPDEEVIEPSLSLTIDFEDPQETFFLAEADVASDDAVIELNYAQDGQIIARDEVHLTVVKPDLDGHRHGSIETWGTLVDDGDEYYPGRFMLPINDDDDNDDGIVDSNASLPSAEDDELVRIVVRPFEPSALSVGTLTLTVSEELRIFTADGQEELPNSSTVDLAAPTGHLAEAVRKGIPSEIAFLVAAHAFTNDAVVELTYQHNGQIIAQDSVHMQIVENVDVDAYWPGKVGEPGVPVEEAEEDNARSLITAVNDDDDNGDGIVDFDRQDAQPIDPLDDELVAITIRQCDPVSGLLRLSLSEGLRVFTEDGTRELQLPLVLDFANPPGPAMLDQFPLAGVMDHDVTFLIEAYAIADEAAVSNEAVVELSYTQDGLELARDEVHLTVLRPEITGSFTMADVKADDAPENGLETVEYAKAIHIPGDVTTAGKTPDTWYVVGTLGDGYALSALTPALTQQVWYKRTEDAAWQNGVLSDDASFESLAAAYNTLLIGWASGEFTARSLLTGVSKASAIPDATLTTEYGRMDAIAEPGVYQVGLALQKPGTASQSGAVYRLAMTVFQSADLDAYWPGVLPGAAGHAVAEYEEIDPLNLFLTVNDDDDNLDDIVDNDRQFSPTPLSEDDDFVRVTMSAPAMSSGIVELSVSEGLRLFRADDGANIELSDMTVDLTAPDGVLADVGMQEIELLVEADTVSDDANLTLTYTYEGQEISRDEVHFTVVNPDIQGGFTRGDAILNDDGTPQPGTLLYQQVDVSTVTSQATATGTTPTRPLLWGELSEQRPYSLLISTPENIKTAAEQYIRQGKSSQLLLEYKKGTATAWTPGELLTPTVLDSLAATYNEKVSALVNDAEIFTGEDLKTQLEAQTALALSDTAQMFVINGLTDPEAYDVRWYMLAADTGKKIVLGSTETILLNLDLSIHHGNTNRDEVVTDKEERRGALTIVNRNDTDADGQLDYVDIDGVIASQAQPKMTGQDEVDLMNLVIRKPLPDYLLALPSFEDKVTVEIVTGNDLVTLWREHTKDVSNNDLILPVTIASGHYEFPVSALTNTGIWIEATKPSATLGDITIQLIYTIGNTQTTDTVKATGIWPEIDVREAARPYNRVGRDDPRMTGDDSSARNKLLIWHDSGNNDTISFEIIKTDVPDSGNTLDNNSPIWVQLEERENLNNLNTMFSGHPFCEIVETDTKTYPYGSLPPLQINSNMNISATLAGCFSASLSEAVSCLNDFSLNSSYWSADILVKYGIDYDESGELSADEMQGTYDIFGVTQDDYQESILRYDAVYLPFTVYDIANELCYKFSHGNWKGPGWLPGSEDYRPDRDGSCNPGNESASGGKLGSCNANTTGVITPDGTIVRPYDDSLHTGDLTHNVGTSFKNDFSVPTPVKNTDRSGGEYPRQYFEAETEVPVYFWNRDSGASKLIRNKADYLRKKIIAEFLNTKTLTEIKNAYLTGTVADPNNPNLREVTFSSPIFSIKNGHEDKSIVLEPIGSIGLGGATLNPSGSGTQPKIKLHIEEIKAPNSNTVIHYNILPEVTLVAFEVVDGFDYNYFKGGLAKITFASVSGSSIQAGFGQQGSTNPYTGQVPRERFDISGVHNLVSADNLTVNGFRIHSDGTWAVVERVYLGGMEYYEVEHPIDWFLEGIPRTLYEQLLEAYNLIR